MCRPKSHPSGGRRCPSHSSPKAVAARNARRREIYAEKKKAKLEALDSAGAESTSNMAGLFSKSVAKDANGNLLKMYHCSSVDFEEFDPKFTGNGNDQYGSGFYFNPDLEVSRAYGEFTHEVYLNIENPIVVKESNLNNITLSRDTVRNIIRSHPNAYLQPENEDDEYSILSDYSPEFWNKDEWSKEEIDGMLDNMADEYFSNEGNFNNLEALFDEHTPVFRKAVHQQTGYDGVIADMGEHGKHYIAWFPEQIQRIPKN